MSLSKTAVRGLGLSILLSACVSPQVGSPCPIDNRADAQTQARQLSACFSEVTEKYFSAKPQKDLDILFLIDNSRSMSPKQAGLAKNIPKFIEKIESFEANYHIGIANSDTRQGGEFGINQCNNDTRQTDGALQRDSCKLRTYSSGHEDAEVACNTLCTNPKFQNLRLSQGFISKINGVTNVPVEMSGGKDIGPIEAFKCIAPIGDFGCGIEAPLEGARKALDKMNPNKLNEGFLRDNSVLAVIFIADEDDCSVRATQRMKTDPNAPMSEAARLACTTSSDPDALCFNADFRCVAMSTQCSTPMNQIGLKTNCSERKDDKNFLEPVDTYVNFFANLSRSHNLVIGGIWTPKEGKLEVTKHYEANPSTHGYNRGEGPAAACLNPKDAKFFGQYQHRLSSFITPFSNKVELSICDVDNYPAALDSIAKLIEGSLREQCLESLPAIQNGKPVCIVGDVDIGTPQNSPDVTFPPCSAGCCDGWATTANPVPDDPTVQNACAGEPKTCYCAVAGKPRMDGKVSCEGKAVAGVWRPKGQEAPDGKAVNFKCAAAK